MQQQWRDEVMQAIDQALAETGRLAERQLAVQEALRSGADRPTSRGRAGSHRGGRPAVAGAGAEDGGEERAGTGPDRRGPWAARRSRCRRARGDRAMPNAREGAEQAGGAVDALDAAAHQLIRARGNIGLILGLGLAKAMERMAELAEAAERAGQQAAGMLPMMGSAAFSRSWGAGTAAARSGGRAAADAGAGEPAGGGRAGRRGRGAGPPPRGRTTGPAGGRAAGAALAAHAQRRPHLPGTQEDERKERQSTTAAGDSVRLPPALRAKFSGKTAAFGCPPGTSCNSSHRRSEG